MVGVAPLEDEAGDEDRRVGLDLRHPTGAGDLIDERTEATTNDIASGHRVQFRMVDTGEVRGEDSRVEEVRVGTFVLSVPREFPAGDDVVRPNVVLITGFRRTGKDTAGIGLTTGSHSRRWRVYARRADGVEFGGTEMTHEAAFSALVGAWKVAFADGIRRIVAEGLRLGAGYDFEENKDRVEVNGKTLRQHMIDVGSAGRRIDPAFWTKDAFRAFFCRGNVKPTVVVCTDWRFSLELTALERAGVL